MNFCSNSPCDPARINQTAMTVRIRIYYTLVKVNVTRTYRIYQAINQLSPSFPIIESYSRLPTGQATSSCILRCSRSNSFSILASSRCFFLAPSLSAFIAAFALPDSVFWPVDRAQGFHALITSACLAAHRSKVRDQRSNFLPTCKKEVVQRSTETAFIYLNQRCNVNRKVLDHGAAVQVQKGQIPADPLPGALPYHPGDAVSVYLRTGNPKPR